MSLVWRFTGLIALGCLAMGSVCRAGGLHISPVILELAADSPAGEIHLRNEGDKAFSAQVRVFRWSLKQGQDQLDPANADEIVASPPIIEVPVGGDQVVRIVRVATSPLEQQATYRLLVDELPNSELLPQRKLGISIQMRYSLPVFITPADATAMALNWSVHSSENNSWVLRVDNSGGRKARLNQLFVEDPVTHEKTALTSGLLGCVLAGEWAEWTIPALSEPLLSGNAVRITAQLDGQSIEKLLTLP